MRLCNLEDNHYGQRRQEEVSGQNKRPREIVRSERQALCVPLAGNLCQGRIANQGEVKSVPEVLLAIGGLDRPDVIDPSG